MKFKITNTLKGESFYVDSEEINDVRESISKHLEFKEWKNEDITIVDLSDK